MPGNVDFSQHNTWANFDNCIKRAVNSVNISKSHIRRWHSCFVEQSSPIGTSAPVCMPVRHCHGVPTQLAGALVQDGAALSLRRVQPDPPCEGGLDITRVVRSPHLDTLAHTAMTRARIARVRPYMHALHVLRHRECVLHPHR